MRKLPPARATVRDIDTIREQKAALWAPVLEQTGAPELVEVVGQCVWSLPQEKIRDELSLARALQEYVQENVRFVKEFPERYQSPIRTLQYKVGDCDDQAPLLAALLRTVKIPARLCIGGWGGRPGEPPVWRHIWAQALLPKHGWTSAETVRRVPLGFDAGEWMASRGFQTARTYVGDSGPL